MTAKPVIRRFVVTVHPYDAPGTIGHTIVVNAFDRQDAQRQARAYVRSLTATVGHARRVWV